MLSKVAILLPLLSFASAAPTSTLVSPPHSPTNAVFNVASPANTPAHLPPARPTYLAAETVDQILSDLAATVSTHATTNDTVINSILYYGGIGTIVSLCPGATILLSNTIFFTAPNQEISTAGYPTGSSRATLMVMGATQACAVYGPCNDCSGIALRNIQVNGNRPGLGWIGTGLALIEIGGSGSGQVVDSCHLYEPRGWSAMHGIEGTGNTCRGMTISNNQVGPAGHAPNNGFQFRKRDNTGNYVPGQWADGISMACQQSKVINNVVTDATDGAIVCFTCASTISGNTIISNNRQLLGGINMVDYGPNNGIYTGTVVTGNTIIAQANFIKVGIAMGGMVWGSDNRTTSRLTGGIVSGNILQSGSLGYFGFGAAVGGMTNLTVSGTIAAGVNFGGEPSNVCFSTLIPPSQAFVIDPSNTPDTVVQPDFKKTNVVFMICQESGPIIQVGLTPLPSNTTTPVGAAQAVPAGDLALKAVATASSFAIDQPPSAAIDGIIGGWTVNGGDYTKEWSSNGSMTNDWILLTWATPIAMSSVALYDRPNLNDHITAGLLTFDDGSTVAVPSLVNDGSALIVTFATRNSKTLLFTVINVSSFTSNSGLSEIAVFGSSNPVIAAVSVVSSESIAPTPTATATSSTVVSPSSLPSSTAQVLSSSSSSNSASSMASTIAVSTLLASAILSALSTGSSTLSSSSSSSQSASSTSTSTTAESSASATSSADAAFPTNLALSARLVASTSSLPGSPLSNLNDGSMLTQWVGKDGNVGSQLKWTWKTPQTLNQIVFYPGEINNIKSGMISFDGHPVRIPVGPLTGKPVWMNLTTARTTKSMTFTVLSVTPFTKSIGLREIMIANNPSAMVLLSTPMTSTSRIIFIAASKSTTSTTPTTSTSIPPTAQSPAQPLIERNLVLTTEHIRSAKPNTAHVTHRTTHSAHRPTHTVHRSTHTIHSVQPSITSSALVQAF